MYSQYSSARSGVLRILRSNLRTVAVGVLTWLTSLTWVHAAPITVNPGDTLQVNFRFTQPFLATPNILELSITPSTPLPTGNNWGANFALYNGSTQLLSWSGASGPSKFVAVAIASDNPYGCGSQCIDFTTIRNQSIDGRWVISPLASTPSIAFDPSATGAIQIDAGVSGGSFAPTPAIISSITLNGVTVYPQAQVITEFSLPTPGAYPLGITSGPDGNLWFTESSGSRIGRITPSGVITEFSVSSLSSPTSITAGPDGNVWFIESGYNGYNVNIGRITPAGVVTEFPTVVMPWGITTGKDGNLWFSMPDAYMTITPLGVTNTFATPNSFENPSCAAAGPDGNVWYAPVAYGFQGLMESVSPSGAVTRYFPGFQVADGLCITAGPDGNLWVAEGDVNRIGQLNPLTGAHTEFTTGLSDNARPTSITAGADGNLWFTEYYGNGIGRITPAGVITEFSAGMTPNAAPYGIAAGPDGNIWFTEPGANKIGRITTGGGPAAPTIDAPSLAPEPIAGPELLPPPPPSTNCVPGDRKLVLITHGWQPNWGPPDITAFQQLKTAIRSQIDQHLASDACNWDVILINWVARAWTSTPVLAYANADEVAAQEYELLKGRYKHVHLIAHSAGSQVIDTLAKMFKQEASPPTIQETLLDPYHPRGNINTYGCQANWAESYVDMRPNVLSIYLLDLANENLTLTGALDIDVTQLGDASWPPVLQPPATFDIANAAAYHAWPVAWYASTVTPSPKLYGWPLSREAGRSTLPSYGAGSERGDRVCLATSGGTYSCPGVWTGPQPLPNSLCTSSFFSPVLNLWDWVVNTASSNTGTVIENNLYLLLTTGSPVWLKMNVNLPQAVDTLQLDAQFTSAAGAAGYLTVFVDGQLVHARQEANMTVGAPTSISIPLGTLAAGYHWVGFRLDPTNAVQSQVQIANIKLGTTTLAADTTPPVITPIVSGTAGNNGWHMSNVSIGWQVTDPETVVNSTSGCSTMSIVSDTSGKTFTCSATSLGGTSSNSITIKRDATPPVVVVLSPLSSSVWTYKRNQAVWAIYGCVDLRSGIDQCAGTVALGARIDTSSAGTKTFTVNARDKAGNKRQQTVTYRVK